MFQRLRSMLFGGGATVPSGGMVPRVSARVAHEAASHAPRTRDWQPPDAGPNVATMDAHTIRLRCRDAARNDSWARAIVETLVDDAIGWGIKPLSRAPAEPFRQAAQALWDRWSAEADADGVLDLAGLQALAVRNLIIDGECFVRLRRRKADDGLTVPLQVQVLPAEICPTTTTEQPQTGHTIRDGIEFDAIGRRVAYYMRDVVPGEDEIGRMSSVVHRVPASQVLHLYDPLRPGQRRGVSMLAPALVRLRELDKYADATLLRLQISTMFVGSHKRMIPTDAGFDPISGERISETDERGRGTIAVQAGAFNELSSDEAIEWNQPPDPPAGFRDYTVAELRAAGAAVGVPYEVYSGDWGATNDRLARVVLSQYRRRVQRLQWSIVIPQVLRPLWSAWLPLAAPSLPAGVDAAVTWAPQAWPYIHPVQDVTATRQAIRDGLTSRQAAVSEQGEDAEVIDRQQAQDNARADALKLAYDSDGRVSRGGAR